MVVEAGWPMGGQTAGVHVPREHLVQMGSDLQINSTRTKERIIKISSSSRDHIRLVSRSDILDRNKGNFQNMI